MTTREPIKTLFDKKIDRRIEEVIKVDQTDEDVIRDEIDEYVVTDAIRGHYSAVLEAYAEAKNKPNEGIAVWVSGFFGSGKSSFAKMLGLAIENRKLGGEPAAKRFAERVGDKKLQVLLSTINEHVKTHAVIFDVSTDRGIRSGNQTLTEIMYGLFLQSLGYAKDLDLSELEIALEDEGKLARFEDEYRKLFKKDWAVEKGKVAFALSEASRVLHSLEPATYPMADSWVKAVKNKADISPGKLAERAGQLMKRKKPDHSLIFVIDEVGQFVARDVQKMLDLQAVVQSLGVKGRGKHWVVVTSQEKLGELVSGLDDKKIELARLMDRFPSQVHLEPSDISEVTSRRVLSKNAAAQGVLGDLFNQVQARLTQHTRLTADIKLPELDRASFIDLYPLLPYQIDLIIQVVSGLRTQGGASKHVGGANRTIIKLAQQLLINPSVDLASAPIGALARLDQVYDLVEGNIGSEIRAKISAISREVGHPLGQPVAKVICLLQYVKSVHRSAENIAAALHPSAEADSQLPAVKAALQDLVAAHKIREGDDGFRIPTPAEDDWEQLRSAVKPKAGDTHRIHGEVLAGFWTPQPSHTLAETKSFKGGLAIQGREVTSGDLVFQLHTAEEGAAFEALASELRVRSQQETKYVFWAVPLSDAIDHQTVEVFRSKDVLARKERDTRGDETSALIAEERVRLRRHSEELRRLFRAACLSGRIYFRGNDRSPSEKSSDVSKAASEVLGQVLPQVFHRFQEAAVKAVDVKKGTDALFSASNLQGLPPVFGKAGLDLLRDEKGKTVFRVESNPLKEVFALIESRSSYGDSPTGRYLSDELSKEPLGWEFDCVRLLVLSLLRAGVIDATSKGQTLDVATGSDARDTFSNNNLFKQASFRPKKGIEFVVVVSAAEAFKDTFGSEVRELNATSVAQEIKREVARKEETVAEAMALLATNRLPGTNALEGPLGQMRAIVRGSEENAILMFNASHRAIKDAIRRSLELEQALTPPRLADLARAAEASRHLGSFLRGEVDIPEELVQRASALEDLLAKETFFKELPTIDQSTRAIEAEYQRRYAEALEARVAAATKSFDRLVKTPGWGELDEPQQLRLAEPFVRGRSTEGPTVPIPQLRADRDACDGRMRAAVAELRRILDGERVVSVSVGSYFSGGIETEEQLDAALDGIREECTRLIGAGKKVIVQ